ncbi:hypothetical protein ACFQE5_17470 [Pseudonocardia hispaniensis]|uniref:PPE family protein n=1 Tax=Pseudonocardia hispaniensis TaxID=904933 RepID=A0ABW1J575_9PSEU
MTEIPYLRYEAFDLRTKFGWLNGAPGIQATEPTRIGLGNLGNAFAGSDDTIRDVLRPLGVDWQGQAASVAGDALRGVADMGSRTGEAGVASSGSVDSYGQSFEAMRPKIAWTDPGTYSLFDAFVDVTGSTLNQAFGDIFDLQSDYSAIVEENRTLDAQANAALYAHEAASREALARFPAIEPAAASGAGAEGSVSPGGAAGLGGPTSQSGTGAPTPPAAGMGGPADGGWPGATASPTHTGSGSSVAGGIGPTGGPSGATESKGAGGLAGAVLGTPTARSTGIPMAPHSPSPSAHKPGLAPGSTSWRNPNAQTGSGVTPGRPTTGRAFGDRLRGSALSPRSSASLGGSTATAEPGTRASGRAAPGSAGHVPFTGGMGGAAGSGPHQHKVRYFVPSSEAFEVAVPHVPPVIGAAGEEE